MSPCPHSTAGRPKTVFPKALALSSHAEMPNRLGSAGPALTALSPHTTLVATKTHLDDANGSGVITHLLCNQSPAQNTFTRPHRGEDQSVRKRGKETNQEKAQTPQQELTSSSTGRKKGPQEVLRSPARGLNSQRRKWRDDNSETKRSQTCPTNETWSRIDSQFVPSLVTC